MLQHLSIRNIILIESLEIPLSSGLCVLTGETGAGKSIILDALGFVLGARAKSSLLRHGARQGSVTAEFTGISEGTLDILVALGIETEDSLILRRVIDQAGKTKAFINDTPIGINALKNIGQTLVEVHGQHDQHGLQESNTQRNLVDAYGGLETERSAVQTAYSTYAVAKQKLSSLEQEHEQMQREEGYLNHIVEELRLLDPQEGEEEALASKRAKLMNSEKMVSSINMALEDLSVDGAIQSAQRILARLPSAQDNDVLEITETLERVAIELQEATEQLNAMASAVTQEEQTIDEIEDRLFALRGAARKYKCPVDVLPAYKEDVENKLALLAKHEVAFSDAEKDVERSRKKFEQAAEQLSTKRVAAANTLQKAILKELQPLKLDKAQFQIIIERQDAGQWHADGWDKVTFLASMNPGTPPGMLGAIASGGELSRFMLALKVVVSHIKSVPTMIFDEVDTGIGGAVADAVGKRLSLLSNKQQVLVVTHQPQVAAQGTLHLHVAKDQSQGITTTSVTLLDAKEREEELARMLAGETVTDQARAAAKTLLEAV